MTVSEAMTLLRSLIAAQTQDEEAIYQLANDINASSAGIGVSIDRSYDDRLVMIPFER